MLRQIERDVEKAPITKNEVLPLATLLFRKFDLRMRSYFEQLI